MLTKESKQSSLYHKLYELLNTSSIQYYQDKIMASKITWMLKIMSHISRLWANFIIFQDLLAAHFLKYSCQCIKISKIFGFRHICKNNTFLDQSLNIYGRKLKAAKTFQKQKQTFRVQLQPIIKTLLYNYLLLMASKKLYGKYLYVDRINNGMYGEVKLVQYNNTTCALKIIPQARFNENEAAALLKLEHPNIVRLIELNQSEKFKLILLEYCNSGNMRTYQQKLKNKVYQFEEALDAFYQVLKGVQYMHKEKFIHRDIKPQNILVHKQQNGKIVYKLADFGFCTGNLVAFSDVGSPYFIAPEVYKSDTSYNEKVDVWALGVTFYNMLNGTYPFEGTQNNNILDQIKTKCSMRFSYRKTHENALQQLDDLFAKIFVFDHKKRISVQGVLSHPLFNKCYPNQINQKNEQNIQEKELSNPYYLQRDSIGNTVQKQYQQKPSNQISDMYQCCRQKNNILKLVALDVDRNAERFLETFHRCLIYNVTKLYIIQHRKLLSSIPKHQKTELVITLRKQIEMAQEIFKKQYQLCKNMQNSIKIAFKEQDFQVTISPYITETEFKDEFKRFYRISSSKCHEFIRISQNNTITMEWLQWRVFICHAWNKIFQNDNINIPQYYDWIKPQKEINASKFYSWINNDEIKNVRQAILNLRNNIFGRPPQR